MRGGRQSIVFFFPPSVCSLQVVGNSTARHFLLWQTVGCSVAGPQHDYMSTETGPTALLFVVGSIPGHIVIPKTIKNGNRCPPPSYCLALSISGLEKLPGAAPLLLTAPLRNGSKAEGMFYILRDATTTGTLTFDVRMQSSA